jgi:multidrug efflux pump subunit AcrA (membrane-fusion protein)
LFARAQIVVDDHEDVLSVPAAAVIAFAGLEKVVIVRDGKAAEKTVTTGRRDGEWVEIVAGLAAGDTVVLNPTGVRTGQPLIVGTQTAVPLHAQTNAVR